MRTVSTIAGLLGALAAITQAQTATGPDTSRTRDALIINDRRAAESSAKDGFRAAVAAMLSDDGALLYAGAPVVSGATAVAALLGAQPFLDSIVVRWQPLSSAISAD